MNYFKYIWTFFPSLLKKFLFPSSILLAIVGNLLYQYISLNKIVISFQALFFIVVIFVSFSLVILLLGYILALHRIAAHSHKTDNNPKPKILKNKEKKKVPFQFEIEIINFKIIEFTIFVKRKWYPDENKPDVEDYIKEIEFSEPRCGICHSDFYVSYSSVKSYECKNSTCENNKVIYEREMYPFIKQIEAEFKGKIRNNFDTYWKKYVTKYDEFTNKKYHDYWDV